MALPLYFVIPIMDIHKALRQLNDEKRRVDAAIAALEARRAAPEVPSRRPVGMVRRIDLPDQRLKNHSQKYCSPAPCR